ncbi:MAG TPA: PVC-type heme-binding CxxCH protein, partial [Humisphaera sp.]
GTAFSGPATAPATRPAVTDVVSDAKGLDYALEKLKAPMRETDPLPPAEALKHFKARPGLAVDLIAAEPTVRQPLCINFDERGRMWVVQYIQYPFPAGLKVVEYDKYIRAKFDKVPPAPPNQFPGKDVVTILEDVDGDGSFKKAKTFVEGLSIATSALPGRGGRGPDDYGVWVMNAPYLLFYPDRNRDDVPDGPPIVHLSGFGLEDTHAVASNLTWGPDGWLYGTQGSTCTAKVKAELSGSDKTTDFLGQAIWRYHPERHVFEIFAEGGGNTFGLEFDDRGDAYSGTNWGKYRGLHYVQGGYYVKGWSKHGPLTNPYAFGWFEHMPHEGNADRLSHTFVVYGGTLLGDEYRGKIISPNSLQSRIQVTRLEPNGSTYKTVEEPFMVTTDDGWFRPVDLKVGPDGAIYVADFYEKRISHVDPRDTWDRRNGRIWRVRPEGWKPKGEKFDYWTAGPRTLAKALEGPDRWHRAMARRVMSDRQSAGSADPLLLGLVLEDLKQGAVEALWGLHAIGRLDERALALALGHPLPTVREWAVRLAGDTKGATVSEAVEKRLHEMAAGETDLRVRSQLASTARRLEPVQGAELVQRMIEADRASDAADPHIPLLMWWAVEATLGPDKAGDTVLNTNAWAKGVHREFLAPRLARRLMAEPTKANQVTLVKLLGAVRDEAGKKLVYAGIKEALAGRLAPPLEPFLRDALKGSGDVELGLVLGEPAAKEEALKLIGKESGDKAARARLIAAVIEADAGPATSAVLLKVATETKAKEVRAAAVAALSKAESPTVAAELVTVYPTLAKDPDTKAAALAALMARPAAVAALCGAVAEGRIPKADLSPADVERLRQFDDPAVVAAVTTAFGKPVRATGEEKLKEAERVKRLVTTGAGDAATGKALFTARCATCHTLFKEGGKVGPDLTEYDRRNVNDMVVNVVDPSAYIREEFASVRVKTKADEAYVGLVVERAADRIVLVDAAGKRVTVGKPDVADERPLTVSLMPEGLLVGLSDQDVRDLFKYLSAPVPPTPK